MTPAETRRLAEALELVESLIARAEGNPLFIEELAAMAAEYGQAALPHSLRALIAARLDLLPVESKRAARAGAVIGEVFWDAAVSSTLGETVSGGALRVLRTRGQVDEDVASPFLGSRQFRFHHALIREVAYDSVSKQERAQLHRRAAAWLEDRAPERPELVLAVAHHLDSALSLVSDVAPLEQPDPVLVGTAVRAQWRAGDWAVNNAARSDALRLERRAAALAVGTPDLYAVSRARLATALVEAGSLDEATTLAEEILAGEVSDEAEAYALAALAWVARGRSDLDAIRANAEPALALARASGLETLEAGVLHALAWADIAQARLSDGEARMDRVAEIHLARGDLAGAALAVGTAGVHRMWRGGLVQAEERAAEALRLADESGSLRAHAQAQTLLAHLRREQGRLEEAIEHGRERLRLELEVGDRFRATGACVLTLAFPLFLAGRLDEAWAVLEQALELQEETGATWFDDSIRGYRAGILRLRGRLDEAEDELEALKEARGSLWGRHSTAADELAKLRAAQGRDDEAERIWRDVLAQPPDENVLNDAWTRIQLARFLAERGRSTEAGELLGDVRAAIEGKGAGLLDAQLAEVETLLREPGRV